LQKKAITRSLLEKASFPNQEYIYTLEEK